MFANRRLPDVLPAAPVTHTRAANGKASPTEARPGCDPDRKPPEVNPSAAVTHAPAINSRAAAPEPPTTETLRKTSLTSLPSRPSLRPGRQSPRWRPHRK